MKTQRQAKIMEIISTRDIETQEQLLEALQDEGFYSTQATISRDIKELRVVKELTSFGTYRYTASAKDGAVVGTLAGDDTVFLVMRDNNAAAAFCGEIKNLLA